MKLRYVLAAGTALGLFATSGIALADNNDVYLDQTGDNNSASIVQNSGASTGNLAGVSADSMKQDGDNNTLTITQSGDRGRVGLPVSKPYKGVGLEQNGDRNTATISQSNDLNSVYEVQQNGQDGAASQQNTLSITQGNASSSHNASNGITIVDQTNDGGVGGENTVTIVQGGFNAGPNAGNSIGRLINGGDALDGGLIQVGSGLEATVNQIGRQNSIRSIEQYGMGHVLTINQSGGDGNLSNGTGNGVRSVSQGTELSPSEGSIAMIDQYGNDNYVNLVEQAGGDNMADILQLGMNNYIGRVQQFNGANSATLHFTGDNNGGDGNSETADDFTDDALAVGLDEGDVFQDSLGGDANSISYIVLGSGNLFAFKQDGGGNTITGTVGNSGNPNSDNNQVAVLQSGNGNTTSFSQVGSYNNLGVSQ